MTIKRFLLHVLMMIVVVMVVLFLVFQWLRIYTNHGQKLELPDYTGEFFDDAKEEAQEKTFELIINDSLHKVGVPGGQIISQNPKPGALVKENRKIYVDVTKYDADEYSLNNDLPRLYGQEYYRTKEKLLGLSINSEIARYTYDKGEPDHILGVIYEGQNIIVKNANGEMVKKPGVKIKKGTTLKFVLSEARGLDVTIPDWTCQRLKTVRFMSNSVKVKIGKVDLQGAVTNRDSAYVISQNPPYDGISTIKTGEYIDIVISNQKPDSCQ